MRILPFTLLVLIVVACGQANETESEPAANASPTNAGNSIAESEKDPEPQPARQVGTDYTVFEPIVEVTHTARSDIRSGAFTSDSNAIVYAARPGDVTVHELAAGNPVLKLLGYSITSLKTGPQGHICGTTFDGRIFLWTAAGEEVPAFSKVQDVKHFCFDPKGESLCILQSDGFKRFDLKSGEELQSVPLKVGTCLSFAMRPGAQEFATTSWNDLEIWSLTTGSQRLKLRMDRPSSGPASIDYSPDGKTLAGPDGVRDSASGELVHRFEEAVAGIRFSPDGQTLVGSVEYSGTNLWDPESGKRVLQIHARTPSITAQYEFSPDGRYLMSIGERRILVFGVREPAVAKLPTEAHEIDFHPDGQSLATGGDSGAQIWDLATYTVRAEIPAGKVRGIHFAPGGKAVLTGSEDGSLKLWNVETAQEERVYREKGEPIHSLDFSPDGATFAVAVSSLLEIWNTETGEIAKSVHMYPPEHVRFSPDGRFLGAAGQGIFVLDTATWEEIGRPGVFSMSGVRFAFSGDGGKVAYPTRLNSVGLWSTLTKSDLKDAPNGLNGTVAYYGDDLAGGADAPALQYASTGWVWRRMVGYGGLKAIEFSPDGTLLAGVSDSSVRIWSVPPDPLATCVEKIHPDLAKVREAEAAVFSSGGFRGISELVCTDTHLFFISREADNSLALNAVVLGSSKAEVIARPPEGWTWSEVHHMTAGKRFLYFTVREGSKNQLYRSDGTADGTKRVTAMPGDLSRDATRYFVHDDALFCSAGTFTESRELFRSNGTAEGTGVVKNLYRQEYRQGDGESDPHGFFVANGKLLFFAYPSLGAMALFSTDGTADGTVELGRCGDGADAQGQALATIGSTTYFATRSGSGDGNWQTALWATDGGPPTLVIDGFQGYDSLRTACVLDDKLYFRAATRKTKDLYYEQLWVSDGTPNGTRQIPKFVVGEDFLEVSGVTTAGDEVLVTVIFHQRTGAEARSRLWAWNPATNRGREVLKFEDYYIEGSLSGSPVKFFEFGDRAWFVGSVPKEGETLLYTDGKTIGSIGNPNPTGKAGTVVSVVRYADQFAFALKYDRHWEIRFANPADNSLVKVTR